MFIIISHETLVKNVVLNKTLSEESKQRSFCIDFRSERYDPEIDITQGSAVLIKFILQVVCNV